MNHSWIINYFVTNIYKSSVCTLTVIMVKFFFFCNFEIKKWKILMLNCWDEPCWIKFIGCLRESCTSVCGDVIGTWREGFSRLYSPFVFVTLDLLRLWKLWMCKKLDLLLEWRGENHKADSQFVCVLLTLLFVLFPTCRHACLHIPSVTVCLKVSSLHHLENRIEIWFYICSSDQK